MANKRLKKKRLKQQQIKYLQDKKITVDKKSTAKQVNLLYHTQKKKDNKKERANQLKQEKRKYLEQNGVTPFNKYLTLSWQDIEKLIEQEKHNFDFNKIYTLKDNERMFIAYRDFTAENSFDELIAYNARLSNSQLLEKLKDLVNTAPTYTGKRRKNKDGTRSSNSSGKAGDYMFEVGKQNVITETNQERIAKSKKKAKHKWQNVGEYKGFQVIKSKGRVSFNEYTPRNLLIIAVTIMENVTELDRTGFYKSFHSQMKYHNPDFTKILPEPRY